MKTLKLVVLTLFMTSGVCAQKKVDVSGVWEGRGKFLNVRFKIKLELVQDGDKIYGFSKTVTLNERDSVKSEVSGKFYAGGLDLYAEKLVYKTPLACMSNLELRLNTGEGVHVLSGRWRGDDRPETCFRAAGGKVRLVKTNLPSSLPVAKSGKTRKIEKVAEIERPKVVETVEVAEEDSYGKALVNELSQRKFYALIIGVNEYRDAKIQNLDNPISDAEALANVLTDDYSFEKENVKILRNATREEIIFQFDELARTVGEKDNLLVFYAGHGIWDEQLNQGYWLPANASMNSKANWISNSTIRDYIGGISSKHTLLVSDACFSGGILKERGVFDDSRAVLEMYKLPSRKAMTSGTMKTVPDKSVFIKYLLLNLQRNQLPLLSSDQLFRNFRIAVINNSPNGQVPQYGPIQSAGDEGGDFIFLRRSE